MNGRQWKGREGMGRNGDSCFNVHIIPYQTDVVAWRHFLKCYLGVFCCLM